MKRLALLLFGLLIVTGIGNIPVAFAVDSCLSFNLNVERSDDDLRKLLAVCDAESKETETQLNAQKAKSSTIAGDVALLDSLIKKAAQQIEIKNQIIKQLGSQINQKQEKIENLSTKLGREQASLAQILRKKNEVDQSTLTELLLSNDRVSEFFVDMDRLQTINRQLQISANVIKGVKKTTAEEKAGLETRKLEQANLKNQIEADKKKTEGQKADKNTLLASSKAQEAGYQKLLSEKRAKAAAISAKLFKFKGNQQIPFGDAYRFAKEASAATGVNVAFILAILKQESDFGKYDGGCILVNAQTGQGKRVSTGELIPNVMKPTRDLAPFLTIVRDLGFDTSQQQFSCPMKIGGVYSGYGGAMGPSQFIPSTWVMFKKRIEAALKVPHANPWNPEHAIMATALYMKDLGAQNAAAEKDAACKYYSGRPCTAPGVVNAFYGNSVMALKAQIQKDIDIIKAAE